MKSSSLSPMKPTQELKVLTDALIEILNLTVRAFETSDCAMASTVEPLEEVIDQLIEEIRMRHINRLQRGKCTIQLGFVLNDLLTNYERISDHCSNLAICVLETEQTGLNPHAYLHDVKTGEEFTTNVQSYLTKYKLPELPAAH